VATVNAKSDTRQPYAHRATCPPPAYEPRHETLFGDGRMKLMTRELEKRFAEVGDQYDKGLDAVVVARYFHPRSVFTWYATEFNPGDRCFYGYVCGLEDEWGHFSLDEMEGVEDQLGIGVERDLYFDEMPLRAALKKDRKVVPDG